MKRLTRLLNLTVCFAGTALFAQKPVPADPCNAKPEAKAGSSAATDFFPFDRFDKELRSALKSKDAVAMAFLVKFPLRINDAGGAISIDDAQALKTHFDEVFTPAVSKEILGDTKEYPGPGCDIEGTTYGRGVIWIEASDRGYAIKAVNRDAVPPYPNNNAWDDTPAIRFVCTTKAHRIVIDTTGKGNLRYRAWNKPKSPTNQPDLEISEGEQEFEGHNICALPVFSFFKNATTVYRVYAGIGCTDGKEPAEARGSLEVSVSDKVISTTWCY